MINPKDVEVVGKKQVGIKMSEKSDIFFIIELPNSANSKIVKLWYNIEDARTFVSIYNEKLID